MSTEEMAKKIRVIAQHVAAEFTAQLGRRHDFLRVLTDAIQPERDQPFWVVKFQVIEKHQGHYFDVPITVFDFSADETIAQEIARGLESELRRSGLMK